MTFTNRCKCDMPWDACCCAVDAVRHAARRLATATESEDVALTDERAVDLRRAIANLAQSATMPSARRGWDIGMREARRAGVAERFLVSA